MNKRVLIAILISVVFILSGCRVKIDGVTIKCNELTGKCDISGVDEKPNPENPVPENPVPENPDSEKEPEYTDFQTTEEGLQIVQESKKYVKQNVKTDCSGFVKKVLKNFNYLDSEMAGASGRCDGRSRGSYGMYLLYKQRGKIVWERDASAKSISNALSTFPGGCQAGDIVFYTYGVSSKTNDCVKHVVIYAGYEGGKHMIIDSNQQDNIVRYREIGAVYHTAMPFACARPY